MFKEIREAANAVETHRIRDMWQIIHHASTHALALRVHLRNAERWADDESATGGALDRARNSLESLEGLLVECKPDECDPASIYYGKLIEHLNTLEASVNSAIQEAFAKGKSSVENRHNIHSLTDPNVRQRVWAMTGGICAYCEKPLERDTDNAANRFVVEHVVPTSEGGPDNLANYVPACMGCNSAKSDRHALHFVRNVLPSRRQRQMSLQVIEGDKNAAGGSD